MKLGPIQKAWIADLRKYPERQMLSKLGKREINGEMSLCCLGQALISMCEFEGEKLPFNEFGSLFDGYNGANLGSLEKSYKRIGLNSRHGDLVSPIDGVYSLVQMNDGGISWLEIADFIEKNSDYVFVESV